MKYIKTNNKWARQRGTTLVELSVVIAVILLLVSVLFIGVTAWRNSANRAACLVNLSTLQKAVRGYENSNADSNPTTIPAGALVGVNGYFAAAPICPAGGKYNPDPTGAIPLPIPAPPANVVFQCPNGHQPQNTGNW